MTDTMYALTNPGDGGRTNSRQVCYAGIVRRLTPLECERLQGYPDGWTDIGSWVDSKGKKHPESSDAARYKALGNSIAIPPWKWVLKRLCAIYERDATMASLFDGIGGFPYIWEQLDGINKLLDTKFTPEDMEYIYTNLGNGINHELCMKFVKSGYDLKVIEESV